MRDIWFIFRVLLGDGRAAFFARRDAFSASGASSAAALEFERVDREWRDCKSRLRAFVRAAVR